MFDYEIFDHPEYGRAIYPDEYLRFLGEVGNYYVNIQFRGKTIGLEFTVADNVNAPRYQVTFLNYKGKEVESYTISHRKDAEFHGTLEEREGFSLRIGTNPYTELTKIWSSVQFMRWPKMNRITTSNNTTKNLPTTNVL